MTRRTILAACLMICSTGAMADQSVDLSLANNSAQIQYFGPMGQKGFGQAEWGVGLLYTESNDVLANVDLHVVGDAGSQSPGLKVGVGVRGYGSINASADIAALALGGQLIYTPSNVSRLEFGAQAFYAPDIVSFADAKYLYEIMGRVGYHLLPDAVVYIGYRKVGVGLDKRSDATLDEGVNVGVKFSF